MAGHLASAHLSQSLANIVKLLEDCDDKIFSVGSELKQLYASSSRVPHLPGSDIMHKLIVYNMESPDIVWSQKGHEIDLDRVWRLLWFPISDQI